LAWTTGRKRLAAVLTKLRGPLKGGLSTPVKPNSPAITTAAIASAAQPRSATTAPISSASAPRAAKKW
jgi:hypothetical protein